MLPSPSLRFSILTSTILITVSRSLTFLGKSSTLSPPLRRPLVATRTEPTRRPPPLIRTTDTPLHLPTSRRRTSPLTRLSRIVATRRCASRCPSRSPTPGSRPCKALPPPSHLPMATPLSHPPPRRRASSFAARWTPAIARLSARISLRPVDHPPLLSLQATTSTKSPSLTSERIDPTPARRPILHCRPRVPTRVSLTTRTVLLPRISRGDRSCS